MDLYGSLNNGKGKKISLHQREICLALKLLVLAARDDNYQYGPNYCYRMMAKTGQTVKSLIRTLKIYRLLSYLYDDIQVMMRRGLICIRSISSIANDIEVRETQRYKYKRPKIPGGDVFQELPTVDEIIGNSIDDLFKGLSNYSDNAVNLEATQLDTKRYEDVLSEANLNFDIGLEAHIDNMITQLNLKATGPYGQIDLGDDDIAEYDDW